MTLESGPKPERIAKVLARAGVCSRRDAERLIAAGKVAVDGVVLTSPALNVTPKNRITVEGKPVAGPAPTRLWLYYKPKGVLTTTKDKAGRPTVFSLMPAELPRMIAIGRLDFNSEGLLLLTNDGELARRLELPSTGWTRRYRVRVFGKPDQKKLDQLAKGITVDGVSYGAIDAAVERQKGDNAWLMVSLTEGKNREIRKVLAALGLAVSRLIRISYGPFQLGKMDEGDLRELPPKILREQLGIAGKA